MKKAQLKLIVSACCAFSLCHTSAAGIGGDSEGDDHSAKELPARHAVAPCLTGSALGAALTEEPAGSSNEIQHHELSHADLTIETHRDLTETIRYSF